MALIEGAESATSACPGEVAFQTAYENAFTGKSAESAAAVCSGEVTSQLNIDRIHIALVILADFFVAPISCP